MTTMEARKAILADLTAGGFLKETEPLQHEVGTCYRCHTTVEPMVSKQWFVHMEPLAKPAIECVKDGSVRLIPDRMEKIYYNWMENIKDWCISASCGGATGFRPGTAATAAKPWWHGKRRRFAPSAAAIIWNRTRIPWTPGSARLCGRSPRWDGPTKRRNSNISIPPTRWSPGMTLSSSGWARMIFSGLEHMKEPPFKTVLFHGLVRDAQGRKMSKSLGNGIDPLQVIDEYGADALRFTLVTGNSPGNDMRFSTEKVSASRNFANKIWNAARFIHMNVDDYAVENKLPPLKTAEDKWIVSAYNRVVREVTDNLEKFELGVAVSKLYDFLWDSFCDWYIEIAKIRMNGDDKESAQAARQVLVWVMSRTLQLLHPFMPYITEEIWQSLPHEGESIMVSPWPVYDQSLSFPEAEEELLGLVEVIRGVRNRRAEMNVPMGRKAQLFIATDTPSMFEDGKAILQKLGYADKVTVGGQFDVPGAVSIVTSRAKVYIPMDELVDKEAERKRLQKELDSAQKQLDTVNAKLQNEKFMSRAPQNVVEGVRQNGEKLQARIRLLTEEMAALQ